MTTPSSTDSPALEVHVIGDGRGESIVLKLPDGRWGVVDCHAASPADSSTNPTSQFLKSRGVETLWFVCLTHPHDDHFLGMAKLIEEFKPREFWRFGCLSQEQIRNLIRYQELQSCRSQDEELSRSARELMDLFKRVRAGVGDKTLTVRHVASLMSLHPVSSINSEPFRIECLSPTGSQVERYEGSILDCIGPDGRIARKLSRSGHNAISVVLRIVYGRARVILGGDLDRVGWIDVIKETDERKQIDALGLQSTAVKVSHHGSETGYCEGLWSRFAADTLAKPIAVVTPRHRHKLPTAVALDHISTHASAIHATCQPRLDGSMARPEGGSRPPLESRIAIRQTFSAVAESNNPGPGRCSLNLHADGNVQAELAAPAVSLM